MLFRVILFLIAVTFTAPVANAQTKGYTSETDYEVLSLIRSEKLYLILQEPCVTITWTCGSMSLVERGFL